MSHSRGASYYGGIATAAAAISVLGSASALSGGHPAYSPGQTAADPRPISPIHENQDRLENVHARLQDRLSVLENRLFPVLTPQPPQGDNIDCSTPRPTQSLCADRLLDAAEFAERLEERVNRLIENLEV